MARKKKRGGADRSLAQLFEEPPRVVQAEEEPCPRCKSPMTFTLAARLKPVDGVVVPNGFYRVGTYVGCPACPWRSEHLGIGTLPEGSRLEDQNAVRAELIDGSATLCLLSPAAALALTPEMADELAKQLITVARLARGGGSIEGLH